MKSKGNWTLIVFMSVICFIGACQSEEEINYDRYYTTGKQLYESRCGNCHNNDGSGLALLYPPLTDTTYLKSNKNKLACIIKNGLNGEITVGGKTYNGQMPAQQDLSDIEIAEIITYITNSFGNNQGLKRTEDVNKDLKNCQ